MTENDDFDRGLLDVRMKIAMEQSEWFSYFKLRDTYLRLLIITFFAVWLILSSFSIILQLNSVYIFIVPNITWFFICVPYFGYKIAVISKQINLKKEEMVVNAWNTRTHNITEIMLLTGLEKIFVEYYLAKNGLTKNLGKSNSKTSGI